MASLLFEVQPTDVPSVTERLPGSLLHPGNTRKRGERLPAQVRLRSRRQ